ncbi:MAG: MFS transporter [Planctomycetota bacterium]|jgi:dipeptide/tripeptide permease|nr:MFS transporter [Planctomycetota bacterium]MDP6941230.1 MFS transporter [Planctomycetota bacterium]
MSDPATPTTDSKAPLFEQIGRFSPVFWIANWMELVERFAYYGVRVVLPVFMVAAFEQGGPEFTHIQKGTIYGIWALVQSFVPIFTGGFADRYGYKLNIAISTVLKIIGYILMGYCIFLAERIAGMPLKEARPLGSDKTYEIFFAGAMFLALGTAIFKPGLQGLIAHQMPKENASLGWGLFYQMVNIGGFIGPMVAGVLRVLDWSHVFLACAIGIALNFIPLFFFKEPDHHGDDNEEGMWTVLLNAVRGLLEPRLFFFTISFAGFWLMFYQLFDILPNFIDDWVDSREAASFLKTSIEGTPLFHIAGAITLFLGGVTFMTKRANKRPMTSKGIVAWLFFAALMFALHYLWPSLRGASGPALSVPTVHDGNLTQEWMLNFNAMLISFFAFAMGYLTGKVKSLNAIVIGIAMSAIAIYALGLSMSGWWILGMIGFFSFGEMTASPTKMRYVASIAPPGKEGLYMGYVNFTVGIGWSIGSVIAGELYQEGGDKVVLARKYLVEKAGVAAEKVEAISRNDLLPFFEKTVGVDSWGTRELLWDAYSPYAMWSVFTWIGVGSLLLIMLYNKVTTDADQNPDHSFNKNGANWVRMALVPIVLLLIWASYDRVVVQGKEIKDSLAVIVQAVMFGMMLAVALTTPKEKQT